MVHVFRTRRASFRLGMSVLVLFSVFAIVTGVGVFFECDDRAAVWQRLMLSLFAGGLSG
jgi:hypothetical protein